MLSRVAGSDSNLSAGTFVSLTVFPCTRNMIAQDPFDLTSEKWFLTSHSYSLVLI